MDALDVLQKAPLRQGTVPHGCTGQVVPSHCSSIGARALGAGSASWPSAQTELSSPSAPPLLSYCNPEIPLALPDASHTLSTLQHGGLAATVACACWHRRDRCSPLTEAMEPALRMESDTLVWVTKLPSRAIARDDTFASDEATDTATSKASAGCTLAWSVYSI